jgi:hypothetical protein
MKRMTTPSIIVALLVLAACNGPRNETETSPTLVSTETLTERALNGEEIVTFVVVTEAGDSYVCLSAEILASIDPQCGAPPGDAENPKLLGPNVADLVAALPIGGDVALTLSPTPPGWTLDTWKIVRDFCDEPEMVQVLEAADRCS